MDMERPINQFRRMRFCGNFFEAYPDAYRLEKSLGNGPAVYYSAPGFAGEIGVIGAIHEKFCNTCNRIRLTSEGFLKLCLYSGEGLDLRAMLRGLVPMRRLRRLLQM